MQISDLVCTTRFWNKSTLKVKRLESQTKAFLSYLLLVISLHITGCFALYFEHCSAYIDKMSNSCGRRYMRKRSTHGTFEDTEGISKSRTS